MPSNPNRLKPRITVVGVGGAGGNAVNNMINSHLEGCEFLVCNTDAQALEGNNSAHKIQLGINVTRGLGAGANPEIGRAAAEESIEEIMKILEGSNMVFITAGMGGGTGTGAASVIAQAARASGILTIGVITKPFHFEGTHRMKLAEAGINELQKHVDTLIIIPNQNLFRIANEKTSFSDAFKLADEGLQSGVRGVTDLMVMPGLINLDFADVRAVMAEMGKAMMGTGEASGERRAVEAAEAAISNPLLDDVSMKGAKGVLINITGGMDMTLFEVDEAANRIRDEVDPDANIIFGSTFDQNMEGKMRISVVATGIDVASSVQARPLPTMAALEPIRRTLSPTQNRPTPQTAGNYGGYDRTAPRQDFGAGALPAGILPSAHMPSYQPTAQRTVAPTMERTTSPTMAGGLERSPEPQIPAMGQTSAMNFSAGATAFKLDDADMGLEETWTKPVQAPTQNIQRHSASPVQPRAERQGNNFIPPKPIDPRATAESGLRATQSAAADVFEETAGVSVPVRTAQMAEKQQVKKAPSLFERFTMQKKDDVQVTKSSRMEVTSALTVEDGGKKEEDELDIPAFLRRQAN
jgi:cell division protein FtsZ